MDPPDFNIDALGDILGSLSEKDLQNIMSLADNLTGEKKSEESESQTGDGSGFAFDPEMLFRLMSIFEKLNSRQNDPRCNLIQALKPLLSPGRQKKADTAIELMKIFSLLADGDIFRM